MLLVEDEEAIAEPLAEGLRREGYVVTVAGTAADALAAEEADVVLLDLRLPDGDGLDVCRALRARSAVPIIVVTARGEEADRVVGLELGADDYVVKPFGIRELIARIRAVTRRAHGRDVEGPVRIGTLEIDDRWLEKGSGPRTATVRLGQPSRREEKEWIEKALADYGDKVPSEEREAVQKANEDLVTKARQGAKIERLTETAAPAVGDKKQ